MQENRAIDPKGEVTQFAIAVFDDWDALQAALQSIASSNLAGTVLHGRKDNGPATIGLGLPDDVMELHFAHSKQRVCCTRGAVAEELARVAGGARSLADALRGWLSVDQARHMQSQIEKERLVLWLRLATPEDYGIVCGRLVQASPHMVDLCNIDFRGGAQERDRVCRAQ
jgi:hypothetical protein